MKMVKIAMALCIFLLLAGCNEAEDVKFLTEEQMQKYVQKRIGEEVELIRVEGDINGNARIEYVFNVVNRNIEFYVSSYKTAPNIDGTRIGNYELIIGVRYGGGVKKHYQEESTKLAEKYHINYTLKEVDADPRFIAYTTTAIQSYDDIDNLTDFLIALDQLYAYDVTRKYDAMDLDVGAINFSSNRTRIRGLNYSHNSKNRLDRETLKEMITKKYVLKLKSEGLTDSEIPQDVWDTYEP